MYGVAYSFITHYALATIYCTYVRTYPIPSVSWYEFFESLNSARFESFKAVG
jgi:hypothetical protein